MARSIVNVIDLGSANIKVVMAERPLVGTRSITGEPGLRILGAGMVKSEGIRKGAVTKEDVLSGCIKEAVKIAERMSGIPLKHAFLSFGSSALGFQKSRGRVVVSRADGEISEYDMERALKQARPATSVMQNREVLETFGLNYFIDDEQPTKDPLGIKGENLEAEVLFITAQRKILQELIDVVDKSGIAVDDVVPSPLGVARSVLDRREREVGVLTLDIGAETSSIGVFEEGLPYSLAVFPFGSNHITNDIALGFQVSLEVAEKIKLGTEIPENTVQARKKLANIIEARMEDMFELIDGHLKKIGRAGLLPGGVVISGGGARLEGVAEFAKNSLRLPARVGKCVELESNHKIADPIWSAAVGIALMSFDEDKGTGVSLKKPSQLKHKIAVWLKSLIP